MEAQTDPLKEYRDKYRDRAVTDGYQSLVEIPSSLGSLVDRRRFAALIVLLAERASIRRLLRHLPETKFILDVPCGGGKLLTTFSKRRRLIGIDSSAAMLIHFKRNGGKETIRADIAALPLKGSTCGLVVCNRILHRLPAIARTAVLKELHRVSAGWAIVYYAVGEAGGSRLAILEEALGLVIRRGIVCCTKSTAKAEIQRARWSIVAEKRVLPGLSGGYVFLLKKV